jgi:hypothetical protein
MAKRRVVDHALFAVLEQSGRSMIRHGTNVTHATGIAFSMQGGYRATVSGRCREMFRR